MSDVHRCPSGPDDHLGLTRATISANTVLQSRNALDSQCQAWTDACTVRLFRQCALAQQGVESHTHTLSAAGGRLKRAGRVSACLSSQRQPHPTPRSMLHEDKTHFTARTHTHADSRCTYIDHPGPTERLRLASLGQRGQALVLGPSSRMQATLYDSVARLPAMPRVDFRQTWWQP